MSTIYIIIGLPGSGKSHYLKTLGVPYVDDIMAPNELIYLPPFAISSSQFCREESLNNAVSVLLDRFPNTQIDKIYFENNPEQCLKNVKNRDIRKVDVDIRVLSKFYNPPKTYLKVWRKT